jgi:predicted nucleotidyltransferase
MSQHKGHLKKLCSFFAEVGPQFDILLAYLFGSRAGGRIGPLSDYDFGVLFSEKLLSKDYHLLVHLLAKLLDTRHVDLVDLNRAPIELRYHVIGTGKLLYEATAAARVEFEAQTLSYYFDYLPILRRQRQELLTEKGEAREAGIQRYRKALAKTQRVLAQARTA